VAFSDLRAHAAPGDPGAGGGICGGLPSVRGDPEDLGSQRTVTAKNIQNPNYHWNFGDTLRLLIRYTFAMKQIGFKGRVVTDVNARPLAGFRVSISGKDLLGVDHELAFTSTARNGTFSTLFSYFDLASVGSSFTLRVFDPVGRLVFLSATSDLVDMPFQLNDIEPIRGAIVIPEDLASGYRVTLRLGYFAQGADRQPVSPPAVPEPHPGLTGGNTVHLLVDNENAWKALCDALEMVPAGAHIHLTQLWLDPNVRGKFFSDNLSSVKPMAKLIEYARGPQAGPVRLCLNDYFVPFGLGDSMDALRKHLTNENAASLVQLRGLESWPGNQLHAKLVVIGDKAFVLGSPLIQSYFDDQSHNFASRRRGTTSALDQTYNFPMHDVSALVEGPAAQLVDRCFVDLWNHPKMQRLSFDRDPFAPRTTGRPSSSLPPVDQLPLPAAPSSSSASQREVVQVVRTLPQGRFATAPDGEQGVLEAYLRAIAMARQFIFMDNQYFTESKIADALVNALLDTTRPHLEVILVFNPRVDIPGYQSLEPKCLRNVIARLKDNPKALQRFGLFSLWSHGPQKQPGEAQSLRQEQQQKSEKKLIRIYSHAKAGVVDDVWATIGSANLDGASLTKNQILFKSRSAIELNLVFFDGVEGLPKCTIPSDLRRTLWAEHLGLFDQDGRPNPSHRYLDPLTPAEQENGGWLRKLWIPASKRKLDSLTADSVTYERARVLQWPPTPKGKQYWWEADDPLATWKNSDLIEKTCFGTSPFFERLGVPEGKFNTEIALRTVGPSYIFGEGSTPDRWDSEDS
jgi:phosphatidylserine/phosphatidylglycerophosphate/cardiolipin synthase-like enzyme